MINLRFLYIVFICIILASCNSDKPVQKRNNEITKICIAASGCYGHCPEIAIEIDSTLSYKFQGGEYAEKLGFYTGSVSQIFWDSLNIMLENIKYKELDGSLCKGGPDMQMTEIILYYDNHRKYILADETCLPGSVQKVFSFILDSYKTIRLGKSDSIKFQTKYQNPPPPPKLKMHQFTPPAIAD